MGLDHFKKDSTIVREPNMPGEKEPSWYKRSITDNKISVGDILSDQGIELITERYGKGKDLKTRKSLTILEIAIWKDNMFTVFDSRVTIYGGRGSDYGGKDSGYLQEAILIPRGAKKSLGLKDKDDVDIKLRYKEERILQEEERML